MVRRLDIILTSHYDIGFTDHPIVCRELQVRYLDRALDLALASTDKSPDERFYWTCESSNAVLDWWQSATPKRRESFLQMTNAGQIDVCAMPFNVQMTLNFREWRRVAQWLPKDLWDALRPRTMMQNDVNGFPRAGVMAMLDVGVEYLWMGINPDTGGSPVPQPGAFWWAMPDGRRILVWNSLTYPDGYFLFEPTEWRAGPLPTAADARYRPPRSGDFFCTTPEALAAAHKNCLERLHAWEESGYGCPQAAVSMTNMWRVDNDPPCELLHSFIAAWNAEGLQPRLSLTTATRALDALVPLIRNDIPVLSGEWPSWWSNGVAAAPQELAASRQAKRLLDAARSPLYLLPESAVETCERDLCFYDEHTAGSWNSAAQPASLDSRGQSAEKALFAYRPLARAELLIGDANRASFEGKPGIHIMNPYNRPFTGWVTLTDDCLRGSYTGVRDIESDQLLPFDSLPGVEPFTLVPMDASQFSPMDAARVFADNIPNKELRLWVEGLRPHKTRTYRPVNGPIESPSVPTPAVDCDGSGWPISVRWADETLFAHGIGDFIAAEVRGFAPRWKYKELLSITDADRRKSERDDCFSIAQAVPTGPATMRDTGPTLRYEQYLSHPRLRAMRRILEIQKASQRLNLCVSIDRLSKPDSAEIFYLKLPVDCPDAEVTLTNGGHYFTPGTEQIPHSCKDFYAIDGQITYRKGDERTVIECYDNALVSLGDCYDGLMVDELNGRLDTAYAILYNNVWYCNFAGDEAGRMDFTFDIYRVSGAHYGYAPQAFPVVLL